MSLVDAPLHCREYLHKLILIINRTIRNVAQVQKRRVCVKIQEFKGKQEEFVLRK